MLTCEICTSFDMLNKPLNSPEYTFSKGFNQQVKKQSWEL